MPFVLVNEISLTFRLRRNSRIKRLQMRLNQDAFEIVAPIKVKNHVILDFLWKNQRWMFKQWQRKQQFIPTFSNFTWPSQFQAGETFPYRAQRLRLNLKFGAKALTCLQTDNVKIILPCQKIPIEELNAAIAGYLLAWYQQEALTIVKKTLEQFCPYLGRWPQSVKLKQQKTRWGSCSSKQQININWLLILAPPGVLEYVVVHELCHLFHRNHGQRFWAKVASCMPEYQQYDQWLARYGQALLPAQAFTLVKKKKIVKLVF